MKIIAFRYGTTEITEKMAFPNGTVDNKIPIALLFFMIEYKNKKILVDVGCDTMPGFELSDFQLPVTLLESYGIKRNDITDVIITHSHHDHIDAVKYYTNANVYIQENELESAEKYLSDSEKIFTFRESEKIDDVIEIKCIGGHTEGSSVVLVKYNDKTIVFCGDECYTKDNLSKNIPTGSSCCLKKSEMFVNEYRKDKYIPILFHDATVLSENGYKVLFER